MATTTEELEAVLSIVREASDAVLDIYNTGLYDVTFKADESPITQADTVSNQILLGGLLRLDEIVPVVSEEGDEALNRRLVHSERFWLVDPLDGTKEFICRTGEFTVCAALIEHNKPQLGVIAIPTSGQIYYGGQAIGSYCQEGDGTTRRQVSVADQDTGIVTVTKSHPNEATTKYIEHTYPHHRLLGLGSMIKYTQIAEGLADASPRLESRLHLWDIAAGHAIVEGAGGSFTAIDGSMIDYQTGSLQVPSFIARR